MSRKVIKKKQNNAPEKVHVQAVKTRPLVFFAFIFKDRNNLKLFWIALVLYAVLFVVYKYALPMPDIFSDSHGYILAAVRNKEVFYRPFGYSRFLQMLHPLSSSPLFLVGFQYFLLGIASLFLFFTIHFLWGFSSKLLRNSTFILIVANPVMLILMNQVSSDALFSALTIIWFTLLLWVMQRKCWWALLLQVLILYWAFTIRYNALYYPAIACLAFLLARKAAFHYRVAGIGATVLIIGATYKQIKATTEKETGADVFAGFSGWQMANNALFLYRHIDVNPNDFDDPEMRLLDQYTKQYIDSLTSIPYLNKIKQGKLIGSIFIWDPKSPLKLFAFGYAQRYRLSYLKAWYHVAPLYFNYGKYIIVNHPFMYVKYYLLQNIGYFFMPELESMEAYASQKEMADDTIQWFGYQQDKLTARYPQVQQWIAAPFPYLHAVLVMFCFITPVLFLYWERKTKGRFDKDMLILVLLWYAFFLFNMAFSIFASIITLRYEVVWFILGLGLPVLFLDRMISNKKEFSKNQIKDNN